MVAEPAPSPFQLAAHGQPEASGYPLAAEQASMHAASAQLPEPPQQEQPWQQDDWLSTQACLLPSPPDLPAKAWAL